MRVWACVCGCVGVCVWMCGCVGVYVCVCGCDVGLNLVFALGGCSRMNIKGCPRVGASEFLSVLRQAGRVGTTASLPADPGSHTRPCLFSPLNLGVNQSGSSFSIGIISTWCGASGL